MPGYNYDEFATAHYDLQNFDGPEPGSHAPDARVHTLDGTEKNILDFDADFLVLELGSITCPLFQGRRGAMGKNVAKYPQAKFSILYVREAHPGSIHRGHKTQADKNANACALRDDDHEEREILIDDLDGTAHKAFGSFPNAMFIINRNGCVVYKNSWNNTGATARALDNLVNGKPAAGEAMFRPVRFDIVLRTLRRAGKGAASDFFKGLPHLIWNNLVLRNIRLLLGRSPRIDPNMKC
jgi:hypothetical protein